MFRTIIYTCWILVWVLCANVQSNSQDLDELISPEYLNKAANDQFSMDRPQAIHEPEGSRLIPVFNPSGTTMLGMKGYDLYTVSYPDLKYEDKLVTLPTKIPINIHWSIFGHYIYFEQRSADSDTIQVFEVDIKAKKMTPISLAPTGIRSYSLASGGQNWAQVDPITRDIQVWNKEKGFQFNLPVKGSPRGLVFSPDRRHLITPYGIYFLENGKLVYEMERTKPLGYILAEAYNETGNYGLFTHFNSDAHGVTSSDVYISPVLTSSPKDRFQHNLTNAGAHEFFTVAGWHPNEKVFFFRYKKALTPHTESPTVLYKATLIANKGE